MRFAPLGDQAVTVTLGDSIDEQTHRRIRAAVARIDRARLAAIIDVVPAFASVTVHYDPRRAGHAPYEAMIDLLSDVLADLSDDALPPRIVDIPVCYGGDLGPDLHAVATAHAMTAEDVVEAHVAGDYMVYMVGFMPGFAYLGGLSERLATPRRQSPRTAVPAGSVGIGGQQTGVYPMVSPGGWNLIGRTPLTIFDAQRAESALLATGDRVRFSAISRADFDAWRE